MARRDRILIASVLILALTALSACTDQTVAPPPTADLGLASDHSPGQLELAAAVAGRTERGIEDDILRLEARVPGIGGLWLDSETGRFTVFLKDMSRAESASEAVQGFAADLSARLPVGVIDPSNVEVVPGQFAFSDLVAWNKALRTRLGNLPEFISIDADERINRVRIEVEQETAREEVLRRAEEALVPPEALEVTVGTRPASAQSATLTSRIRPTGSGLQIHITTACTHGWTVRTGQGEEGLLTAAHCVPQTPAGGTTGQAVVQPQSPVDVIGEVHLNPTWAIGGCSEPVCTRADVAFVTSPEVSYRVARPSSVQAFNNSPGTLQIAGWWTSIGSVIPSVVGLFADKVGRTTGWTRGEITASCVDVVVNYQPGGLAEVLCSNRVSMASAGGGDSGAPVFWATSNPNATLGPFGVLFAWGPQTQEQTDYCDNPSGAECFYYFSNWSWINWHLGRTFNPIPPLDAMIVGPHEVRSNDQCTWQAVTSGGEPPLSYSWSGVLSGSGLSVSGTVSSSGWLNLDVTSNDGQTANDQFWVTVSGSAPVCPE